MKIYVHFQTKRAALDSKSLARYFRDWKQNRSYMPEETMERFGVSWERYGPDYVDENWRSACT